MRVLITGGAGFIGRHLIKKLVERGHEPICFDLIETDLCESIIGDITDREAVFDAVKGVEAVLHLAAEADVNHARNNPANCVTVNVGGTQNIIEACTHHGAMLHFASTCCVYGDTQEHPSNEQTYGIPTEIYAVTKLLSEHMIREYSDRYGLRYNILRYGTTYGPRLRGALAIYIFIHQAFLGIPITIDGTGEQTRCFVYIDDLVDGTIKVLESGVVNKTVNLNSEEEVSVLDVARIIQEEIGVKDGELVFVQDRLGQIMKERIDASYAWRLFGWRAETGFRDGIKKTVAWFRTTSK